MNDFQIFMPIMKMDKDNRTVSGYASTPSKDSDGEIITLEAVKKALPDYMAWGNIREMHQLSAVGTAEEANIDKRGLYLTAKIVDDEAWKKCQSGVYKGFSIGGRKLGKDGNKITAIDMTEISVVDRPANSDCSFALAKREKDLVAPALGFLVKVEKTPEAKEAKKLAKAQKLAEALAKAGPPAAKDGLSLPAPAAKTEPSPKDSSVQNNKAEGEPVQSPAEKSADKPYGDVTYADPGHRKDGKARYPIDSEDHIRAAWNYIHKPKNAKKYGNDDLASVKNKIIAAWKEKIHKDGPPSIAGKDTNKAASADALLTLPFMELGKAAKVKPTGIVFPRELELKKSMSTVGSLSYVFDSLRSAQRSLIHEGKAEGGDKKDQGLAMKLGRIAKDLSGIISQKAEHEGAEALDLSDAEDQWVRTLLGEDEMSDNYAAAAGGDPLENAVLSLMKRAATPSPMQRFSKANDMMKQTRKAAKEACKTLKAVHDMHKAAFLAKAAKVKKKDDTKPDDDDFDHAGAMEKLQKAYGEMEKARTFGKAAMGQMAKGMAGRSGQKGQEAGDPVSGVYEVPPGIMDLSPRDIATAGPGGGQRGSAPPLYPDDGSVYAGKSVGANDLAKYAKNGVVSLETAQLLMEKASAESELAALRRMPANFSGGRRPMAFDTSKVFDVGSNGHVMSQQDINKALFDGVNTNAIGSGDERAHTEASAKAIGNFLTSGHFGKSIMDPAFKGAAGGKS
jgi:phage head maturation protease